MVAVPKSGVLETTVTTGTGAYTLAGATAGYRALTTGDTGLQFHYAVRTATQFEVTIGTYTHSTRQLSRDLVIANHSNNTSPVNWGIGTKEVAVVLIAERVAMTDVENIWRAQQYLRGNSLWLDADDDTGFVVTADDIVSYRAGGAEFVNYDFSNKAVRVISDDSAGLAGPNLQLFRNSVSPANLDALGAIQWLGKDSAAAIVSYGYQYVSIETVTAGAVNGLLHTQVAASGTLKTITTHRRTSLSLAADINLYTTNKTASNTNVVGVELSHIGYVEAVVDNGACLYLNRKGSDGTIIDLRRDNVNVATVNAASGVVTWGTFTGSHDSDWADSPNAGHESRGTVVCAEQGLLEGSEHLPLVRPSFKAGERQVYGVVVGRTARDRDEANDTRNILTVAALGTHPVRVTGPIEIGDLLETSDLPGVARRQSDDQLRASTLGKAVQNSADDGTVRLVPAVLYAG